MICLPAAAPDTPSVLVIDRSAVGVTCVRSVALLSVGSASVAPAGAWAVAVLLTVPSTATTVATSVNVTDAPTVMSTVVEIAPLPLVAAQLAPGDGTHVHVEAVSSATAGSETVAPTASDGPSLVTTIV